MTDKDGWFSKSWGVNKTTPETLDEHSSQEAVPGSNDSKQEVLPKKEYLPKESPLDNMTFGWKEEGGRKNDEGKLRWDVVQPLAIQEYVKVLTHGAKKYLPDNWRNVPNARARYFAALMRHLWKWRLGELYDPESGFHHLGHAMCCLAFLLEPELEKGFEQAEKAALEAEGKQFQKALENYEKS